MKCVHSPVNAYAWTAVPALRKLQDPQREQRLPPAHVDPVV